MINLFASSSPLLASAGGIVIAVLFIIAAVYVYITIQLFRFATLIKESIERQDQVTFNHALKALRNYLMASGIVSLVVIVWSLYDTIRSLAYNF
jgi:predicted metal-binding membrane protein